MKDIERRLISELMKNSRRSDRELAKALGTSQPTITRTRGKLEREGIIKEYTMIPDFTKLGYRLMGLTFIKEGKPLSKEEFEVVRKKATELEKEKPHASLMAVSGMGLSKNRFFITFYEDYSAYTKAMSIVKQIPYIDVDSISSFLVDLTEKDQYRILTMSVIAKHVSTMKQHALLSKRGNDEKS